MNVKNTITGCILGAKGSGKSVFLAKMLNDTDKKMLLFDILGVFNPRAAFRTAIVPNSYYVMDIDSLIENFDKFPSKAKIILNCENYVNEELIEVFDRVSEFLLERRQHIGVLSDEIADVMPNMSNGSKEFHRLVKNGRNYGIKPVIFATQRPQSVSKNIFDLCDEFFISKQKAPRTIEYIKNILDVSGDTKIDNQITNLKTREFLITNDNSVKKYTVPEWKYCNPQ
jgi:hypothetical protein